MMRMREIGVRRACGAGHGFSSYATIAISLMLLLSACASWNPLSEAVKTDRIAAAFVVLGEHGEAVARVITFARLCPLLDVDGVPATMRVRASAQTVALRPTRSDRNDSKPSAFPVLTCEQSLPVTAREAQVGTHVLPLPKMQARRIVVIGDSGCRMKLSDHAFQACNDPDAWPFASVAAAAAATKPDMVVHVGDYHYRENACPSDDVGCAGSPWGYGWDAWDADFFTPARPLLEAAPWIVVRGNHESCNRAGQGWWRFLDPRPLVARRDCNDALDDAIGNYSEPYAVPLSDDAQVVVFDSSNVGVEPLAPAEPTYHVYSTQMQHVFALSQGAGHTLFVDHHPILGFAPDARRVPTGLYPGNAALQSVLAALDGERLFPRNVEALISGHVHLFQSVSFATDHPAQFLSGNAGTWTDAPLPSPLPPGAIPAPGAVVDNIVSTNRFGFLTIERRGGAGTGWQVIEHDRSGRTVTMCDVHEGKVKCVPMELP